MESGVESNRNKTILKYTCEDCQRQFRFNSSYLKHKNLYPFKHKFFMCCKKIENEDVLHECQGKKQSESEGPKNDEEAMGNTVVVDIYIDSNAVAKDENKEEGTTDVEEPDAFDELFKKQKRPYKRKTDTERSETQKTKLYKCQECSKSFSKSSSLGYHQKIVHEKNGKFKCQTCDEVFQTSDAYYKHLFQHGPEDKVVCKGCRKVFDSLKLFYFHARQNPGIHCFLCKLCLRKFPSELLLEQHVCICTNGQPMVCACEKRFTRYQDVIQHSRGTKPFHCCCCDHVSTSLTAYLRHMRRHSKQKYYECKKCNLSFAVIDFYNIHLKKVHGEPEEPAAPEPLSCSDCSEQFGTAEDLRRHGSVHERVSCPDCGKLLKRSRLKAHRNTHKRSASLCPECGKLFETRFKLTQHIITIHNTEPVKCEICGKVLKTKKILNEHMKTHLKSEVGLRIPQAICPMCGLGLAQKGSLARHILLMHEKHKIVPCTKSFTCSECSEVLPSKAKYYSHRRMHKAMIDRFPCEVCGRVFNKKQNLRRHVYLLHDERRIIEDPIYGCQICTRSFREKKNLRRHYKMVHKWEDVNV